MNQFLLQFFTVFLIPFFAFSTVYLEKPDNFNAKVEIAACFLEYDDEILFLHRQNNKTQGNLWGIPGGKIDQHETPLQAVIREVREETGYDISKKAIENVGKVYIKYPTFDYVYHMFKCKPIENPGDVKIRFEEHKGFTWVTPSDALNMRLMLDEDTCVKLVYENQCQ